MTHEPENYDRLTSAQQQVINSQNLHKTELKSQITDYEQLKTTLLQLRDTHSKPCYVPFGGVSNKRPKCFLPGKLVRTNEVLMLLGDGYFLETTTKNAIEIIDSRVSGLEEKVGEFGESAKKLSEYKDLGVELKEDDERTRKFDEMMMDEGEFTEEDRAELERLESNYKNRWESVGGIGGAGGDACGDAGGKSKSSFDPRYSGEQKAAWGNPEMIKKQKELKEKAKLMNSGESSKKSDKNLTNVTSIELDENVPSLFDEILSENLAESVRKSAEIEVDLSKSTIKERRGSESDDAPISPRGLNPDKIMMNRKIENLKKSSNAKKSPISDVVIERSEAQENVRTVPEKPKRQSKFRQNLRK